MIFGDGSIWNDSFWEAHQIIAVQEKVDDDFVEERGFGERECFADKAGQALA